MRNTEAMHEKCGQLRGLLAEAFLEMPVDELIDSDHLEMFAKDLAHIRDIEWQLGFADAEVVEVNDLTA